MRKTIVILSLLAVMTLSGAVVLFLMSSFSAIWNFIIALLLTTIGILIASVALICHLIYSLQLFAARRRIMRARLEGYRQLLRQAEQNGQVRRIKLGPFTLYQVPDPALRLSLRESLRSAAFPPRSSQISALICRLFLLLLLYGSAQLALLAVPSLLHEASFGAIPTLIALWLPIYILIDILFIQERLLGRPPLPQ